MSEERDVPLPGVTIQKELDARDWTQRDLAYVLGTDETAINRLLKGHYRISADMARALASAFGKELRFFADLQTAYDVAHARAPSPEVEGRARLQSVFPIRDMIRRGWLENTEAHDLEVQLTRFFVAGCSAVAQRVHRKAVPLSNFDDHPVGQLAILLCEESASRRLTI